MRASLKAVLAALNEEAIVLSTYPDVAGVLTIGAGHTAAAGGLKPVPGLTITIPQALALFAADKGTFERQVNAAISVPLAQNEFDALWLFDINTGAIKSGSIDDHINAGDKAGGMTVLQQYRRAGGKVNDGLVARRAREDAMFEKAVYPAITHLKVYDLYPGPVRLVPVSSLDLSCFAEATAPTAQQAPTSTPKGISMSDFILQRAKAFVATIGAGIIPALVHVFATGLNQQFGLQISPAEEMTAVSLLLGLLVHQVPNKTAA